MNKSSENELSKFSFGFLQQRILWIGSMSVGGSSRITSLGNTGKPYRLNGHFAIFNFALNNRASSYRFMIFINRPFLGHTFHIRNWPIVVNRGFSPYSTFCRTHFSGIKKKAWSRRHLLTQWVTTTQSTNKHKTTHAPDGM